MPDCCSSRVFFYVRMRDSPELHWSTQAGTSSSVRDPYPACGLIFHRRPLSGLPPHFRRERRIKRWGIAAGTATGAALGTKSNAKAERKCQNFALVTTLFSGSASPRRVGRGSSQYLLPSSPVATHFPALSATMPRGEGATQPDADTPLSCDVCAWLWYCVITSSAIPHGYTP